MIMHKRDVVLFVHRTDESAVKIPSDTVTESIVLKDRLMVGEKVEKLPLRFKEKEYLYNDLIIQYWAWKNVDSRYYGFCKDNKLLSFATDHFIGNDRNWIWFYYLDCQTCEKLCLNEKSMYNRVKDYDFILSDPYKVNYDTIMEYYSGDEFPLHQKNDLEIAINILINLYPSDKAYAETYLNGNEFYPDNLFIAKKEAFNDYCEWLFPILFKLENSLDMSFRSREGLSAVSDIGYILLGIYYIKILNEGKLKTLCLQRAFVERGVPNLDINPMYDGNATTILIASSDLYVPYCCVTLSSIIQNSTSDNNYDIIVFQQDMTKQHMNTVKDIAKDKDNISIRFIDPRPFIPDTEAFQAVAQDFGVTRFPPILAYRAFVPYILKNFKRVIWCDCDLVFEHDAAELFAFNMKGNIAAFAHDIVISSYANGSDRTVFEYYSRPTFMNNIYMYGNAGVVMLDLDCFRAKIPYEEMLRRSTEMKHQIPEQDTINGVWEGNTIFIDRRWNIITFGSGPEWIQRFIPANAYDEFLEARKDPYVVHFVGPEKPWNNPNTSMSEYFWKYARTTPLYEVILSRMLQTKQEITSQDAGKSKIRKVADFFMPVGSRRREILKELFPTKGSLMWNKLKKFYYSIFE